MRKRVTQLESTARSVVGPENLAIRRRQQGLPFVRSAIG